MLWPTGWRSRSERVVDQGFHSVRIASRTLQASSVSQGDDVLAVRARLQVLDPAKVDDDRTVNAQEHLRGKRFLESVHRHMQQVACSPSVQFHVILRGFDP